MKILDVYEMTETTGAVTANTPDAFRLGTVGRPLPGMELKIAEDGEILVRGPVTSPGISGRRRRRLACSVQMAGCTPATSAHSTQIGSFAWSAVRRNSSSRPGERICPPQPSKACLWSTG